MSYALMPQKLHADHCLSVFTCLLHFIQVLFDDHCFKDCVSILLVRIEGKLVTQYDDGICLFNEATIEVMRL